MDGDEVRHFDRHFEWDIIGCYRHSFIVAQFS